MRSPTPLAKSGRITTLVALLVRARPCPLTVKGQHQLPENLLTSLLIANLARARRAMTHRSCQI